MTGIDTLIEVGCNCAPACRIVFPLLLLGLAFAGPAAVQTFGLDGGLAARPQAEWVRQAQALEKARRLAGPAGVGRTWADAKTGLVCQGARWARADFPTLPHIGEMFGWRPACFRTQQPGQCLPRQRASAQAMLAYRAAVEITPVTLGRHNLGLTFYLSKGRRGDAGAAKLQAIDPALADVWRALQSDIRSR
jgi:hypothetical protein